MIVEVTGLYAISLPKKKRKNKHLHRKKPICDRVDTRLPGSLPQAIALSRQYQQALENIAIDYSVFATIKKLPSSVETALAYKSFSVASWWKRAFLPSCIMEVAGSKIASDAVYFRNSESTIPKLGISSSKTFLNLDP